MKLPKVYFSALLVMAALIIGSTAIAQDKLILTTMHPVGGPHDVLFRPWAEKVNQQAKGTVAIELTHGVTLANYGNVYQRVQDDVVQMGLLLHGLAGGQFGRTEVIGLPLLTNDGEEGSAALWRLYKTGLLDAEYRETVPVLFGVYPQVGIHFAKAPRSLDSLPGLKIAIGSKTQSDIAQRLGSTPISVVTSDLYESLKRGTVDGVLTTWGAVETYKLGEATNYHLEAQLGTTSTMLFMKRSKFNALSAPARAAIEENGGEAGSRMFGKHSDGRQVRPTSGQRAIVQLTAQQESEWRRLLEPMLNEWAAARPDGTQVLAAYRTAVADVRAKK